MHRSIFSHVRSPSRRFPAAAFLLSASLFLFAISFAACAPSAGQPFFQKSEHAAPLMIMLFDGAGTVKEHWLLGKTEARLRKELAPSTQTQKGTEPWILRLPGPQKPEGAPPEDRTLHSVEAAQEVRDRGHKALCKGLQEQLRTCGTGGENHVRLYLGGISRGACTALSLTRILLEKGCADFSENTVEREQIKIQGLYLVDMVCFENQEGRTENPPEWTQDAPASVPRHHPESIPVHHIIKPAELDNEQAREAYQGKEEYYLLTSRMIANPEDLPASTLPAKNIPIQNPPVDLEISEEEIITIRKEDTVTEYSLSNKRYESEERGFDHFKVYKDPVAIAFYQELLISHILGKPSLGNPGFGNPSIVQTLLSGTLAE